MRKTEIVVLMLICLNLACMQTAVSAAEVVPEPLSIDLKAPVEGAVYQDKAFFLEADRVIKSLKNRTLPTGSQRMNVYSAYINLRVMKISPANYEVARAVLAFLYYTAKTGEAYENYFEEKKSVAATTDGSEYYDLAALYYQAASAWWALIADLFPAVTLYAFPSQNDPYPGDESGFGTILEGMKYPLVMLQVAPNTNKPYQDEEIKTTIQRWVEDNIDTVKNQSDTEELSQGHTFIMSDGPRWAKSTYLDLTTKNVNPDFYDTANYINAFLYFISQARENFDQYLDERTSIFLISDGNKPFTQSKIYYDQAGIALSKFIDQVPALNKSTTLPPFPLIDEIPKGRVFEQDKLLSDSWGGVSWTGGHQGLW